jgi:hypothetical protein
MREARVAAFTLSLVTPHADRAAHFQSEAPTDLRTVVTARLFEQPRVGHHPWTVPEVASLLDVLLIPELRGPSQREQLWAVIHHECGTPWQPTATRPLSERVSRAYPHLALGDAHRVSSVPPDVLDEAIKLLARIPQLESVSAWSYTATSKRGCSGRSTAKHSRISSPESWPDALRRTKRFTGSCHESVILALDG